MAEAYNSSNALKEISTKLDHLMDEFHQMEIHLAEIKGEQKGKVDQMQYRLNALEAWKDTANKYLIGLVMAFLTAVVVGLAGVMMKGFGGS